MIIQKANRFISLPSFEGGSISVYYITNRFNELVWRSVPALSTVRWSFVSVTCCFRRSDWKQAPRPISVAPRQCPAARQVAFPSWCPGLKVKSTGMMHTMQQLTLHTTRLIPTERAVIPHLQSQISPQSSLLVCHHYSLCDISQKKSLQSNPKQSNVVTQLTKV